MQKTNSEKNWLDDLNNLGYHSIYLLSQLFNELIKIFTFLKKGYGS